MNTCPKSCEGFKLIKLPVLVKTLKALFTWIWTVYLVLPGRSTKALSVWTVSVHEPSYPQMFYMFKSGFWLGPSGTVRDVSWTHPTVVLALCHKGLSAEVLLRWLSSVQVFSFLYQSFWSSVRGTVGFPVTSLTEALISRSLSLAERPTFGRVLVVPVFFHLTVIEAIVLPGTLKVLEMVLYLHASQF